MKKTKPRISFPLVPRYQLTLETGKVDVETNTSKTEHVSWLPMDKQRTECHFDFDRSPQTDEHQDRRRHRARSSGMAQIINCIYKLNQDRPRPIMFAVGPRRFSCDILVIVSSTYPVSLTSTIRKPPQGANIWIQFFIFIIIFFYYLFPFSSWNRYRSWRTKLMSALPLARGKWTRFEVQNRFLFYFFTLSV